jgi:hypothetical protein
VSAFDAIEAIREKLAPYLAKVHAEAEEAHQRIGDEAAAKVEAEAERLKREAGFGTQDTQAKKKEKRPVTPAGVAEDNPVSKGRVVLSLQLFPRRKPLKFAPRLHQFALLPSGFSLTGFPWCA